MLPLAAQAEVELGGQVVLGYGEVGGVGDSYGILSTTIADSFELDNGTKFSWEARLRGRTDQDYLSGVDDSNFDVSAEFDFGTGGVLRLTTYNDIDQYPWADGELFNRGSVGVFPVIQKQYDGVTDSQFTAGGPGGEKVDPDLLLTYSVDIGRVGFELNANVLGTWDGYERSEMTGGGESIAIAEAKFTLPTRGYGIYSLMVNDIGDAEAQVVYPMRERGITLIGRYSINEGNFDEYRGNLTALYRPQDMGVFKGVFFAHAFNDSAKRSALGLTFGQDNWEFKVAGDTDGDVAVEGSYALTDSASLMFGWDNGFDNTGGPGDGFDDDAFPAPVFAAGRDEAFEVAFVYNF